MQQVIAASPNEQRLRSPSFHLASSPTRDAQHGDQGKVWSPELPFDDAAVLKGSPIPSSLPDPESCHVPDY